MPARKSATSPSVTKLAALLDEAGIGGRGPRLRLPHWLRAHHDDFRAMLDAKEPGWDEVATALAAMGVCDGAGKPPTGARVRKTWWAVRRDVAARRARRAAAAASPPLAPGEIAPAVRLVAAPQDVAVSVESPRPRARLDIRPALPLAAASAAHSVPLAHPASMPPAAGATDPSGGGRPAPSGDVEAELRRVRQDMGATKVPLPKIVR